MGLDTTIYVFQKLAYDELADTQRRVGYFSGRDKGVVLRYYRKHQCLQDILGFVTGGTHSQTTFHELTEERMTRAAKLALRLSNNKDPRWKKEELTTLFRDLIKIAGLIDFDETTVSFLWIS